jgi:hypothetical protein
MFKPLALLSVALGLGLMLACAVVSKDGSFAPTHPQALDQGRPTCSDCHGTERVKSTQKTFASFDHTAAFVADHRVQAGQDPQTCAACHAQSFCADCHGGKTAMLPSTKLGNRPDRSSPHRTGYLTMHRFDGKADPTSCYECHGRANNEKCSACHQQ